METFENANIATITGKQTAQSFLDTEELVTVFNQMSEEAKAQFYRDCENGISAAQSRQNLLQFVRQLWQK